MNMLHEIREASVLGLQCESRLGSFIFIIFKFQIICSNVVVNVLKMVEEANKQAEENIIDSRTHSPEVLKCKI